MSLNQNLHEASQKIENQQKQLTQAPKVQQKGGPIGEIAKDALRKVGTIAQDSLTAKGFSKQGLGKMSSFSYHQSQRTPTKGFPAPTAEKALTGLQQGKKPTPNQHVLG